MKMKSKKGADFVKIIGIAIVVVTILVVAFFILVSYEPPHKGLWFACEGKELHECLNSCTDKPNYIEDTVFKCEEDKTKMCCRKTEK